MFVKYLICKKWVSPRWFILKVNLLKGIVGMSLNCCKSRVPSSEKTDRHIRRLCIWNCCRNHTLDLSQRGCCSSPLDSSIFRSSLARLALILAVPENSSVLKSWVLQCSPCGPNAGPASCVLIKNVSGGQATHWLFTYTLAGKEFDKAVHQDWQKKKCHNLRVRCAI